MDSHHIEPFLSTPEVVAWGIQRLDAGYSIEEVEIDLSRRFRLDQHLIRSAMHELYRHETKLIQKESRHLLDGSFSNWLHTVIEEPERIGPTAYGVALLSIVFVFMGVYWGTLSLQDVLQFLGFEWELSTHHDMPSQFISYVMMPMIAAILWSVGYLVFVCRRALWRAIRR